MVGRPGDEADVDHTLTNTKEIVLVQSNHYFERKLGNTLYACYPHICTLCTHTYLSIYMPGLQAAEGVHYCPGSNEVHLSRLLEDGLRERVWCDCHAVRLGGEWRGWVELSFIQVAHTAVSLEATFLLQEVCYQYWPADDTKGAQKYGEFTVSVLQTTKQNGFIQCEISIKNPKVMG